MSLNMHANAPVNGGNGNNHRTPAKKPFVAKGHDAQLQHAQFNNVLVEVVRISTDEPLTGFISRRDKYTITLRHERGDSFVESIIYKHAIESVTLLQREVH